MTTVYASDFMEWRTYELWRIHENHQSTDPVTNKTLNFKCSFGSLCPLDNYFLRWPVPLKSQPTVMFLLLTKNGLRTVWNWSYFCCLSALSHKTYYSIFLWTKEGYRLRGHRLKVTSCSNRTFAMLLFLSFFLLMRIRLCVISTVSVNFSTGTRENNSNYTQLGSFREIGVFCRISAKTYFCTRTGSPWLLSRSCLHSV